MLLEKEIKKVLDELVDSNVVKLELNGFSITIKLSEGGTLLFLSTRVYGGGNYIPKSVRESIKEKPPFDNSIIQTSLKVNEDSFKIFLNYSGPVQGLTTSLFVGLLEEYSWLAERWREFLDENDKKDLVHIHAL